MMQIFQLTSNSNQSPNDEPNYFYTSISKKKKSRKYQKKRKKGIDKDFDSWKKLSPKQDKSNSKKNIKSKGN
jgi:hypothetical protein